MLQRRQTRAVSEKFKEISRSWFGNAGDAEAGKTQRGRMDLRLVPAALLAWAAAICSAHLPAHWLLAQLGIMIALAVLFFWLSHWTWGRPNSSASLRATLGLACILAAGVSGHAAILEMQREHSPMVDFAEQRSAIVADVVVTAPPRPVAQQGGGAEQARWAVPVRVLHYRTAGLVIHEDGVLTVLGSGSWGEAVPGQHLRATGRLKEPWPGQQGTTILSASSEAAGAEEALDVVAIPTRVREAFREAAAGLPRDASGLLPGMVTGDTEALDEDLEAAMQIVGMSHLTAVSGANCSLVLGALLLLARSLRLPRMPAAALALAGLGLFVLLVGPDASVLRAALMGSIALASLTGGRTGRGLSFLCLAVIGLLLFDPGLGTGFGFLLSVLATLGIIVVGQKLVDLAPAFVPRCVAAALAVPLSAQLLCGPVIVLLQPQFSTYSMLANVLAAPLVAPVTLLGTAAVPLTILAPWAATALIAVAGTFCGGVAGTARFMAGLPGASLPWPEGSFGLGTMAALSGLTLGIVLLALHPRAAADLVLGLHSRIEWMLEKAEHSAWLRSSSVQGVAVIAGKGFRATVSGRNSRVRRPWPGSR